jgi:phage terminase small subunit
MCQKPTAAPVADKENRAMLTPKMEKFAQAIVSGLSQADAYRAAYNAGGMKPATVQSKACVLMKNGNVRARVVELRAPVIAKVQYGLEQAMNEAQEAFNVSRARDNGAAMVAAVMLRARLNGLLVDRREVTLTQVQTLSDDDLDRLIALKSSELGMAQTGIAVPDAVH